MTAVGFEPTTTRLKGACSTTELHGHDPSLPWTVKREYGATGA